MMLQPLRVLVEVAGSLFGTSAAKEAEPGYWSMTTAASLEPRLISVNAVSRDLLKSYERGLYEHCALHAGDPHWGGMIAERKP